MPADIDGLMTAPATAPTRRPPLLLAVAAVVAGCMAVYSVGSWMNLNVNTAFAHYDVRMYYVAAEAGLRYGWSTIYDQAILRALSTTFPAGQRVIDNEITFASPPLLAWLFAPLTTVSEPMAYALWTVLSVAALVFAWYVAAPYTGVAKLALLLAALGVSPVFWSLYLGQPTMILIAFLAGAWALTARSRPVAAGAALAFATFLKPQVVILVPAALLLSGHYRLVASWAAGCALLGIASVVQLGPSGLMAWWNATREIQNLSVNTQATLAYLLGNGPVTYALWALQGAIALLIAWRRRRELEMVFAVGLIGTIVAASYLHEQDYSTLVLAAWLLLRMSPPMWQRWWLLAGILSMQLLDYTASPQLIFDAAWLGMLLVASPGASGAAEGSQVRGPQPAMSTRVSRS
jgi:hypothetical protein